MQVLDSAIFWGWQVLDLVISEGGQFRTLFYSGFWHIGKFGGGKKDQPPCRILYVINSIIFFKYSFNHYPALFPTDLYIREDVICLLDDLEGLLGTLGVSRVLVRARKLGLFLELGKA